MLAAKNALQRMRSTFQTHIVPSPAWQRRILVVTSHVGKPFNLLALSTTLGASSSIAAQFTTASAAAHHSGEHHHHEPVFNPTTPQRTDTAGVGYEKVDSIEEEYAISFITDVEGNLDYLRNVVQLSDVLEWTDASRTALRLKNPDQNYFVFGGDAFDKGHDQTVAEALVNLKLAHPDRVALLLGNRDVNKMKLSSEIDPEEVKSTPPELVPTSFWWPAALKHAPPAYVDYIHAIAMRKGTSVAAENTPLNKLHYMLEHTMGSQSTFELRRAELAERKGIAKESVTDQNVVDSFYLSAASPDGFARRYIECAQLAAVIRNSLFVHGGLDVATLGFIPDLRAHHDHRRLQPLHKAVTEHDRSHANTASSSTSSSSASSSSSSPSPSPSLYGVHVGPTVGIYERVPGTDLKPFSSVRTWAKALNDFSRQATTEWSRQPHWVDKASHATSAALNSFTPEQEASFHSKHPLYSMVDLHHRAGLPPIVAPADVNEFPAMNTPPTFTAHHAASWGVSMFLGRDTPSSTTTSSTSISSSASSPSSFSTTTTGTSTSSNKASSVESPLLDIPVSAPAAFVEEALQQPDVIASPAIHSADIPLPSDRTAHLPQLPNGAGVAGLIVPRGPRDDVALYRTRGGQQLMGTGYRPSMTARTVVVQNHFAHSNPTYKPANLVNLLNNSSIYRVLSGHLPWGDSPGLIRHPLRDPNTDPLVATPTSSSSSSSSSTSHGGGADDAASASQALASLPASLKPYRMPLLPTASHDGSAHSTSTSSTSTSTRADGPVASHIPPVKAPLSGLEIIDADTSYSDTKSKDNRGIAAAEVVVKGVKVRTHDPDLNASFERRFSYTHVRGVLANGLRYAFNLMPLPEMQFDPAYDQTLAKASPVMTKEQRAAVQVRRHADVANQVAQRIDCDPFVGLSTPDGWWVKVRLPSVDLTGVSTYTALYPTLSSLSSTVTENSAAGTSAPATTTTADHNKQPYYILSRAKGYNVSYALASAAELQKAAFIAPPMPATTPGKLTYADI